MTAETLDMQPRPIVVKRMHNYNDCFLYLRSDVCDNIVNALI